MYTYKEVEECLALMFGFEGDSVSKLSARLKHFLRLGFTPSSPGKGKKISYTFEDVAKWALALRLLQFGMDPTAARAIVDEVWIEAWKAISKWQDFDTNYVLTTRPFWFGKQTSYINVSKSDTLTPVQWDGISAMLVVNLSHIGAEIGNRLVYGHKY